MNKQTIIKLISLVSLLITMGLTFYWDALHDELMLFFWPLQIVVIGLSGIMAIGYLADLFFLAQALDPFLPRQRMVKITIKIMAAMLIHNAMITVLFSPMKYWFGLNKGFNPSTGEVFQSFVIGWLMFLTMNFLYFWLVKPVMQLMMSRLTQSGERL